ncbi:hypothetical protein JSE7799_01707 [Jannaschia seosinensis]|uniref:DUF2125 domain-containing protein n=1 Tax=Jannaschia seosinensis TaxID=313367 RepID=A0A0M7BA98_9RHOB|nr:hypothetical protein [Jannaschia seosinensis]CUH38988.1 hypothetical protein JSE7799_01707 [Jannaschia seosinensis]
MPKHAISGAAALMLATAPAFAEVDARTIWSDWRDMSARFGGALTAGDETYSGGVLTLDGVTLTTDMAGTEGAAEYGTIRLIERDDGTVRVELPSEIVQITTSEVEGEAITQTLRITYDDLDVVVSEEDGPREYDIAANSVDIAMTFEAPDGEGGTVTITMQEVDGLYRSGIDGDASAFAQDLAAAAMVLRARSAADEFAMIYTLDDLTAEIAGNLLAGGDEIETLADFPIRYAGTIAHSGSTLGIIGDEDMGGGEISGASEAGTLGVTFTDEMLGYVVTSTSPSLIAQWPDFPVPVELAAESATTEIAVPFGVTGEAAPFRFLAAYRDVVLNEAVWGMFDPTGQLPREPATVVLDLDGEIVPNVDIFGDPEAMAELQGPPGDLRTLSINEILIAFAGAELRGEGELEFPGSGAMPEPLGTIELALDGGFALLDRIVALGLIPAEQAAFIRGMAGAVAAPTGPDQLESTIEFTEGGGVTANGMPLR